MSTATVLFIAAGAACGGFVNGLAGFGTALFALGWWLQIMPPLQAVPVVLAMSVISGVQGVVVVRKAIDWKRLSIFLVPALFGIPAGLQVLDRIDGDVLKLIVAGLLILFSGYFLFRRELPNIRRATPVLDGLIGLAGGFLGAVAGLSGALPTMWSALRDWNKAERRALLQPYNLVVLAIAATVLVFKGRYDMNVAMAVVVALPVTVIATQCGLAAFHRLSDHQFRRLLVFLMLVSGLSLVTQQIL